MAKTKEIENMDALIKGAFGTLVKDISRKLKRKEPSEKETRDYVYSKLQQQLTELEIVTKSPESYFRQSSYSKYMIVGEFADIIKSYADGEKLQSLILLVAEYYNETPENQELLKPALKNLIKKIEKNNTVSLKRGIAKVFSLAQPKKAVQGKQKQK